MVSRRSGQIKGDLDIAGIGGLAALFANVGIAVLLPLTLCIYLVTVTDRPHSTSRIPAPLPRRLKAGRMILMTQADVQSIARFSIIIEFLVNLYQDDEMPLYHIFTARELASMILAEYTAATIHVYPTEHAWTARLFVVAVCMVCAHWNYLKLKTLTNGARRYFLACRITSFLVASIRVNRVLYYVVTSRMFAAGPKCIRYDSIRLMVPPWRCRVYSDPNDRRFNVCNGFRHALAICCLVPNILDT